MEIRNDSELRNAMMETLKPVIADASNEIMKILQRNILRYTYLSDSRGKVFNKIYVVGSGQYGKAKPTFQFLDAFQMKPIKKDNINKFTSELFYNWQGMDVVPDKSIHFQDGQDIRSRLADILNIDGFIASKNRKAFWDRTIDELENKIDEIFRKSLKKNGLIIQ